MSSERLEELFFDDRNKLRVWKPEAEVRRTTRRTGAKNLARESDRELRKYVESERIKALGSSNSMAKQRGIQQHQTLIIEESTESEGFLCPTSIPMENRIGTTGLDRRNLKGNHKDGNLDRINRSAARRAKLLRISHDRRIVPPAQVPTWILSSLYLQNMLKRSI